MKMHITTTGGRIKVNGRALNEMTFFEKSFLNNYIREMKNNNLLIEKNERRNSKI